MGIVGIVGIFAQVALVALQTAGVLTPGTTTLITSLMGSVSPLITSLLSGQSKTQDLMAVLGTLSAVLATLKAQTNLDPKILTQIQTLDEGLQAAAAAFIASKAGVDLTVLTPIEPIA